MSIPHRHGPNLASFAQLLALATVLFALLPAARAAALLALGEVVLFGSFAAGSGEAHGFSAQAYARYAMALMLQLLPGRAPTLAVVGISIAVCSKTYSALVRVRRPPLPRLDGRIVVVTGSSAGIGQETATQLLELGATVLFACRSEARAKAALAAACSQSGAPPSRAAFVPLDLASCASVVDCAAAVARAGDGRCDVLVCNAGLLHPQRTLTKEGWEANLACHALGHHLLAKLLLPLLRASPSGGRVVSVSSTLHKTARAAELLADPMSEQRYAMFDAYARSKLAQIALTNELQRREASAGSGVVCVSLHPGNVITEVTREMPRPVQLAYRAVAPLIRFGAPSLHDGAATSVYAAAARPPSLTAGASSTSLRGAYLERCERAMPHLDAADEAVGRAVWELAERLLAPWLK